MQHSGMANDFVCCTFSVCELAQSHVLHLCNVQTPPGPFCPDLQTWERPLQLFLTLVAFHTVERLVPFALCNCTLHFHMDLSTSVLQPLGKKWLNASQRFSTIVVMWSVPHFVLQIFQSFKSSRKGKIGALLEVFLWLVAEFIFSEELGVWLT